MFFFSNVCPHVGKVTKKLPKKFRDESRQPLAFQPGSGTKKFPYINQNEVWSGMQWFNINEELKTSVTDWQY